MIKVFLKNGKEIQYYIGSKTIEKSVVDRFKNGTLNNCSDFDIETTLNIKISDIDNIIYVPNQMGSIREEILIKLKDILENHKN